LEGEAMPDLQVFSLIQKAISPIGVQFLPPPSKKVIVLTVI